MDLRLWAEAADTTEDRIEVEVYVRNFSDRIQVFDARLAGLTFCGASGIPYFQIVNNPPESVGRFELAPRQERCFRQDVSRFFANADSLEDAVSCELAYWNDGSMIRTNPLTIEVQALRDDITRSNSAKNSSGDSSCMA